MRLRLIRLLPKWLLRWPWVQRRLGVMIEEQRTETRLWHDPNPKF
jgi:hypothetical protein